MLTQEFKNPELAGQVLRGLTEEPSLNVTLDNWKLSTQPLTIPISVDLETLVEHCCASACPSVALAADRVAQEINFRKNPE